MPYMEAVVKESLRLYPPGHILLRETTDDLEIKGEPCHAAIEVSHQNTRLLVLLPHRLRKASLLQLSRQQFQWLC